MSQCRKCKMEFVPDHMMDRLCYYCKIEAGLIDPPASFRGGYSQQQPSNTSGPAPAPHSSGGTPVVPGTSAKPDIVTLGKSFLETIQNVAREARKYQEDLSVESKKDNMPQNKTQTPPKMSVVIFWVILAFLFLLFRIYIH